jgi:spore coat protein JB
MEVSVVDRCKFLREISAVSFAAWELHLYLDTHPCDEKALEMHKKYSERAMELKKEYEECFGPLTHKSGSGYVWVKEPWPWEYMECGC